MTGVALFLGTPSAPWHVLQTSNLAPRMTCASAAFPGEATAGISGKCPGSAARAGAASAAAATRTAKTVGKWLLVMFHAALVRLARGPVTRPTRWNCLNMPQSGLWRKMPALDASEAAAEI